MIVSGIHASPHSPLAAARGLSELGLSIFPLRPRGKTPVISTWAQYQAAAANFEQITQWWTDNPRANIAVATGEVSGVLVLDVDGEEGAKALETLEAVHGQLPKTWLSRTGKGKHLWFEFPAGSNIGNSAGKLGRRLDTRGQGGYVAAPGSVHENGTAYTWEISPDDAALAACPLWLVRLLNPPPPTPRQTPVRPAIDNRKNAYAQRALESEFHSVARAPEGQRNDTLNRAAHNLGQLVAAGGLGEAEVRADLLKAAAASGLPASEAERTIGSGLAAGLAKPREMPEPPLTERQRSKVQGGALIACCASDFLKLEFPPLEYFLFPYLRTQGTMMVHAARGVGKTQWAVAAALAMATGTPFLRSHAPKPVPVLYVDGELPGGLLQERVREAVQRLPKNCYLTPNYLRLVTPDLQDGRMPNLVERDGQKQIEDKIGDAKVVILDTISTLFRTNQDANQEMSWVGPQDWILSLRQNGISTLLLHHQSRSGNARGTGKKEDILDVVAALSWPEGYDAEEGCRFKFELQKARHVFGKDAAPFEAELRGDIWTTRDIQDERLSEALALREEGKSYAEIERRLKVPKSTLSRWFKKADDDGASKA